jgi:hypothetical protein
MRGEIAIALCGTCFRLRPSFSSLVALESEVGSLFALMERAGRSEVRLQDIAAMFWHCLDGAEIARADFESLLLEAGLLALLPPYRALLASSFAGQIDA